MVHSPKTVLISPELRKLLRIKLPPMLLLLKPQPKRKLLKPKLLLMLLLMKSTMLSLLTYLPDQVSRSKSRRREKHWKF